MTVTDTLVYEVIEVLTEAIDEQHDFRNYPARALLIDCFPECSADEIDEVLSVLRRQHDWTWLR